MKNEIWRLKKARWKTMTGKCVNFWSRKGKERGRPIFSVTNVRNIWEAGVRWKTTCLYILQRSHSNVRVVATNSIKKAIWKLMSRRIIPKWAQWDENTNTEVDFAIYQKSFGPKIEIWLPEQDFSWQFSLALCLQKSPHSGYLYVKSGGGSPESFILQPRLSW